MAEPSEPSEPSDPGAGDVWQGLARTFDAPASYVIRVEGALSPDWSERLGGLRVAALDGGRAPVTELTGELPDQAALLGVLTTLYNLGFPLLAVAREAEGAEGARDATGPASTAAPAADATRRAGPGRRRRPTAERTPTRPHSASGVS
jgi:hypothetical protein